MSRSLGKRSGCSLGSDTEDEAGTRIYDPTVSVPDDGEESLTVWGFEDTRFQIDAGGCVEVTGSRYSISGFKLPAVLSWMENVLQLKLPLLPRKRTEIQKVPDMKLDHDFLKAISTRLDETQLSHDLELRIRHGHGHSQAEIYSVNYGSLERIPDLIVYPETETQVEKIVQAAAEHNICAIPFGGGTNVSEALLCPANEDRMIVSLDMQQMNRIQWIDPVNRIARIEAGATGRHINAALSKHGLMIGHEPDSVEFSTLGGWISTNASGMKKNKYGNIEDIVLDVNMVTAKGTLSREGDVSPRESTGCDPTRYIFGSEGNLGIITSAVVKLFPLPKSQIYGSIIFPSFKRGLSFMYDLTRASAQPASVRLVDNLQFQLSQVLKPANKGLFSRLKSWLEKFYILRIKRFDPNEMAACTLVFEGTPEETRAQQSMVYDMASRFAGLKAGAMNGNRGYQMTFAIAYLRDFIMRHGIIAESFETSVSWSKAEKLCKAVKERIEKEYAVRELPGRPFMTCRISQVYTTGVTVYFYLAAYLGELDDPSGTYEEIERVARNEILRQGGSLSHHHGIGKLRKDFLERVRGDTAMKWNRDIKAALDPMNVFGVGNAGMG